MKLTPLFFLTAAALCSVSCSSKDSDSPGTPKPKGADANTPEGKSVDGKAELSSPFLWLSDKKGAF